MEQDKQDRRKDDERRKDDLKELAGILIQRITSHTEPSPKTLEMFAEINSKFDVLNEKLFGEFGMDKTLSRVEEQTKKTNGSVRSLLGSRAYMTGAIAVIVLIGVPILGYLAEKTIDNSNKIASLITNK